MPYSPGIYDYVAISIFFSTEITVQSMSPDLLNKKVVIDSFFDQFNWQSNYTSYSPSTFNIGDLIKILDLGKRWTYIGSETEPPC